VISAPVVSDDEVYVACFEGTSFAFKATTGGVLWTKKGVATSAPLAVGNQVVLTRKVQEGAEMYEGMVRVGAQKGEEKDKELLAKTAADYLREDRGSAAAMTIEVQKSLDSSVGFASAPAAAKIAQANKSVGVNSVVGGWAFQGSRAAHNGDSLFNAQGKYLNSVNAKDGKLQWQAELTGAHVNNAAQVFAPPALGREYIFLAGSNGLLMSVRQKDGVMGFAYALGKPIAFQPALANGNIYLGTAEGSLICLRSGNKDADGWYSWGGNAKHNK
jgi:outer membrane protein assembly factor BamB